MWRKGIAQSQIAQGVNLGGNVSGKGRINGTVRNAWENVRSHGEKDNPGTPHSKPFGGTRLSTREASLKWNAWKLTRTAWERTANKRTKRGTEEKTHDHWGGGDQSNYAGGGRKFPIGTRLNPLSSRVGNARAQRNIPETLKGTTSAWRLIRHPKSRFALFIFWKSQLTGVNPVRDYEKCF